MRRIDVLPRYGEGDVVSDHVRVLHYNIGTGSVFCEEEVLAVPAEG